jgi:hypothetical protein
MAHGICRYSHPGTFGHECGKPATWAQHNPHPEGSFWIGGYWHARCDACRTYTGPDNDRMRRDTWEPYDSTKHRNTFVRNRWPAAPEHVTQPA